ncbi:MAG: M15 family metallopeptidase [Actinomycetota bacterium]
MNRRAGLLAAGLTGGVIGALIVLALPVPGTDEVAKPPPPRIERADVETLLVWTPSQIPTGLPERIERLKSVEELTVVRSGVAWRDPRPDAQGYAIPLEIAAIDGSYRAFVPPAERSTITRLRHGGAIIGGTSASLRGADVGYRLSLGGRELPIAGILDDTLVGAHELVVGLEEGERLGIVRPRYILVAPKAGTDPGKLEAAIRRVVPGAVRVRIRLPGETPVFRHGDAVLSQVQVKEIFGEFAAIPRSDGTLDVDEEWERENIETGRVPVLGRVTCHRLIVPLVRAALEDLDSRGLGRLVNPADFGGCYYPRYIASNEGAGISHHSWGIAIDINVSEGLPGRQPTLDRRVVDAFERQGFIWGGRFLIPDGTHFEFQRFPS